MKNIQDDDQGNKSGDVHHHTGVAQGLVAGQLFLLLVGYRTGLNALGVPVALSSLAGKNAYRLAYGTEGLRNR